MYMQSHDMPKATLNGTIRVY